MPYSQLSGAVISSQQVEEHEAAMLEMPVDVRDGDDKIVSENFSIETVEPAEGDEPGDRVEVKVDTEQSEQEVEQSETGEVPESDELDFSKADTKAIDEVASIVTEADAGKDALMAEAVEKGLDPALVAVLEAEVAESGKPSQASYDALAAVGYTKAFVDAFIAGQEANAQKYISAIHAFAGGKENFEKLTGFLGAKHSGLADAFNSAIDRNDVATMKAILETSKGLYSKEFGKAPARSITNAAKPATVGTQSAPQGFESRADMIKAMSDKRYQTDAKYRREVELRVFASEF